MMGGMSFPFAIRETTLPDQIALDRTLPAMDEEEFRSFYERTSRPLWAYLARITGDRHQADDVLQEAYYRFYRAGRTHESEAHRRNSLFQIATNLVRDAARRAKHHTDVSLEEESTGGELPNTSSSGPEHQAAARTDLARAMQQLEPVQREMLWLAYAQGASHEEIAETLGLKTISIRTILLRARRKLARILTEEPGTRMQEVQR